MSLEGLSLGGQGNVSQLLLLKLKHIYYYTNTIRMHNTRSKESEERH